MTNEDLARMIRRIELRQIIQEKEKELARKWGIKYPGYVSSNGLRIISEAPLLDNEIESLQTELVHLKDKLKQLEENLKE